MPQKLKPQQNSKHSQHVESYLRPDIVVNRIDINLVYSFDQPVWRVSNQEKVLQVICFPLAHLTRAISREQPFLFEMNDSYLSISPINWF